jgi:hypothetical protein
MPLTFNCPPTPFLQTLGPISVVWLSGLTNGCNNKSKSKSKVTFLGVKSSGNFLSHRYSKYKSRSHKFLHIPKPHIYKSSSRLSFSGWSREAVQHLPSKHKALGSNSSTANNKKKKKRTLLYPFATPGIIDSYEAPISLRIYNIWLFFFFLRQGLKAQAGLELQTLLLPHPEYWNYRHHYHAWLTFGSFIKIKFMPGACASRL